MMTGYVVDSTGAKIGGATVTAQNLTEGTVAATTTSADDGSFTLDLSSTGKFQISATKEGYSSLTIQQSSDGSGDATGATATTDTVLIWPT